MYGSPRNLHVLTPSFPTRRSSDLPTGENPWHGHPNIAPDAVRAAAAKVTDRGWQIFAHANGDAAIDMAIETYDALGITAADDRRPIIIHSQFQDRKSTRLNSSH